MQRILVGGPVRQEPAILFEHLRSLLALEAREFAIDFAFIDDNEHLASRAMLQRFARPGSEVKRFAGSAAEAVYARENDTHVWTENLYWRVAEYRDHLLRLVLAEGYDGLFMVDSDLVLHPRTLTRLIELGVDVASEVFWTRWSPARPREEPQVWMGDQYRLFDWHRGEGPLSREEQARREELYLAKLRRPGVYEVGGLGACTLIARRAIARGATYREVPHLPYWGEDRHFCTRAAVLGIKLYADTCYPPLHLYRPEDLARVEAFWEAVPERSAEIDALRACKAGLEAWGTSHHATLTGYEGADFMAAPMRERQASEAAETMASAQAHENVSRLLWLGGDPQLVGNKVAVTGQALQLGREDGKDYKDAIDVAAHLVVEAGAWRITDMALTPGEEPSPILSFVRKTRANRVLLSMLVHNEADRYLERVLAHAASYVDGVLILDDASDDDTVAVCKRVLAGLPHDIISMPRGGFHEEHKLRRTQWELAVAAGYDWILCLDADEIFEDRIRTALPELINQDHADVVSFRLYDFWSETHYREDGYWQAHRYYRPFLVRPVPGLSDDFRLTNQHSGRFPAAVTRIQGQGSDVRLKHLGWSREADRRAKYERYMRLDPEGKAGILAQYESILDAAPGLVAWTE